MPSARLGELCSIQIGYRTRPTMEGHGDDRVIAISDLDQSGDHIDEFPVPAPGRLWVGDLQSIAVETGKRSYYLRERDVLMLARGQRRLAVPIVENYVRPWPPDFERTIVPYWFYILRPKGDQLRSDFLAWMINEGPLREMVHSAAAGSVVKVISIRDVRNLTLELIPREVQDRVIDLYHLSLREHHLTRQLAECRLMLAQQICRNISEGTITSGPAS